MWLEQYKRTFWGTQLMVLGLTAALYMGSGRNGLVGAFAFAVMQGGAVAGAMVATRLRKRLQLRG